MQGSKSEETTVCFFFLFSLGFLCVGNQHILRVQVTGARKALSSCVDGCSE